MKSPTNWYVYILRCRDNSLYTGITTDVEKRFQEHKNGTGSHYTRSHPPVEIVYTEKASTRSEALKREYEIKHMPTSVKQSIIH